MDRAVTERGPGELSPTPAPLLHRLSPLLLIVALVAADVTVGGGELVGLLAGAPLLAAALLPPRTVLAVGATAVGVAATHGTWVGVAGTSGQLARLVAVAAAPPAAVAVARHRLGRESRMAELAGAADLAHRLRHREEQQIGVAQLGACALAGLPLPILHDQAGGLVTEVLGIDGCEIEPAPAATAEPSLAGSALTGERPVVVADLPADPRAGTTVLAERGLRSCAVVPIVGQEQHFGVLTASSRRPGRFDTDDVVFLQLVANVLAAAAERDSAEMALRHAALHDGLTGLPNRTLLLDRLQQSFARCRRSGGEVVALFVDLDDFKRVNDTLGHAAGDDLLVALADRLRRLVRPTDTVARIAGDEFVILCEDADGPAVAQRVAERVRAALTEPFPLPDGRVIISASIGIALGRSAGDPETLLRHADAGMYRVKRSGTGGRTVVDVAAAGADEPGDPGTLSAARHSQAPVPPCSVTNWSQYLLFVLARPRVTARGPPTRARPGVREVRRRRVPGRESTWHRAL
jgi:diguanylate cyclase (GGDEF)-like protein